MPKPHIDIKNILLDKDKSIEDIGQHHIELNRHGIQGQYCKPDTESKSGGLTVHSVYKGTRSPFSNSKMNEETAIEIGSITKMYTAALLLKLYDNALTKKSITHFPEGMETRLSHFMEGLKAKSPENEYLSKIESDPNYDKITLRDLLNHTHGLGRRQESNVIKMILKDPDKQFTCSDMVNFSVFSEHDKPYGEYSYSNLGCDLTGMIIELVSGKSYDQALKDEILSPIKAKHTYTQSELPKLYEEGEQNVAEGVAFFNHAFSLLQGRDRSGPVGIVNFNTSCNSRAAAGLKSTPKDIDKFSRAFLATKVGQNSLFKNQKTVNALHNRPINPQTEKPIEYHFCVKHFGDNIYGHDGDHTSSESILRYDIQTGESFYYAAIGETLTFCTALLDVIDEKGLTNFKPNEVDSRKAELNFFELIKEFPGYQHVGEINKNKETKKQTLVEREKPKTSFKPELARSSNGEIHASYSDGPNDPLLQTLKHKVKTVKEIKQGKSSWEDRTSERKEQGKEKDSDSR